MTENFPYPFLSGLITAGYLVLGLFFLRFWRSTRDSLFANFAVAFWLLAANQAGTSLGQPNEHENPWLYCLRLLAFLVIIAAIACKNIRAAPRR